MNLLQPEALEDPADCPYLPGRVKQYAYFLADQLDGDELSRLLAAGWRKFGPYFFRPACPDCRLCIPLRVPVAEFAPSRSQRRVQRGAAPLSVAFDELQFSRRGFEIYRDHSRHRFDDQPQLDNFLFSFYLPSCPSRQIEIRAGEELVALGFVDLGSDCLSSVYFCFDPAYSRYRLGTLSILAELAEARAQGLTYYYLGYFVPGCARMAYKDRFLPREHFDWQQQRWVRQEGARED